MVKITNEINGKKYKVARGGCQHCAFNRTESKTARCAYTEEVGGVLRLRCNLKFGEHYEEVRDED